MYLLNVFYIFMLIVFMVSCKKPYNPPAITAPGSYLVVEGVINAGSDSTVIKLSKTVNLSGSVTANPIQGAALTVESNQNNIYPLTETVIGHYVSGSLNLNINYEYRLRIKTIDGKEYLSNFEPINLTPPIDSVGYINQSNGIQIYVNTHDLQNNTKYYRWDYNETWQFHAKYQSQFITNGKKIVPRTVAQQIYSCFANDTSSSILLGSSAKLMQDVIYQSPVAQVASASEKLETKYSILVNQYALTSEAYNFWLNLKKNTEQLGNIFDAQPSTIMGNIHSITNPAEPVLGYISVSTVQHKRIFITNDKLPQSWLPAYPYSCQLDSALFCHHVSCQNDVALFLIPPGSTEIPVTSIVSGPATLGYFSSSQDCTDCTLRGFTKQPVFWK